MPGRWVLSDHSTIGGRDPCQVSVLLREDEAMKAITVCQPFASLIALPESDERHKRTENRVWTARYRGPIAIHAGKSREWLEEGESPGYDDEGFKISELPFGAIVCVADLIDWPTAEKIRAGMYDNRFPWLRDHQHVEGPFCMILQNVRPLAKPIPWKGAQGLWDVPDEVLAGIFG